MTAGIQISLFLEGDSPADTRRRINVCLMLVHRLRRWTNVKPALIQRLVSVENSKAGGLQPNKCYHSSPVLEPCEQPDIVQIYKHITVDN